VSVVFVTRELPAEVMAGLRAAPEVEELRVNPHDRPVSRPELLEGVRGADCLLSQLVDRIDAEVLDAGAGRLRLVANYAVGLDNVDVAAATARGVAVSNTPDVLTETTADLAWALILAVARRVVESDRVLRAGGYPGWSPLFMLGSDVHDKTLGVVGLGRIGAAVARRAHGFGMRILYSGPRPKPAAERETGAERAPFERLLTEADVVSLHPYLDASTRHLIDADALQAMKPTALLVNVSRGPVVDEVALVRALREGWIAGAGLDVFEDEPDVAAGLTDLDNAVLLPHLGSATSECRAAMGRLAAGNCLDLLAGRRPRTCVNPEVL